MPITNITIPAGVVFGYASTVAPTGYLLCDGSAISRVTFASLFNAIGVTHGNGDGSTTFNIPDYRGRFIRGYDPGATRDLDAASRTVMASGGNTGNNIGTLQGHAFQDHNHTQNSHNHTQNAHGHTATVFDGNADTQNQFARGDNGSTGTGTTNNTTATNVAATATNNAASATGGTSQSSSNESRPVNANAWYIIKI